MKERNKNLAVGIVFCAILAISVHNIATAEPKIRVIQDVGVEKLVRDSEGNPAWTIGEITRVGPGGYTEISYCVENKDESIGLKGYYVTFIIDPEKTMGSIDWEKLKEEANSPTGYRWDFGDNLRYAIHNTYLFAIMGNLSKEIYNCFSGNNAETLDLDVFLCIADVDPQEWMSTDAFQKFAQENIFGVSMEIPDLEPVSRTGRHKWCIEEGIELKWYQRLSISGGASRGSIILDKHVYPKAYVIINKDARIGDTHKVAALVCSANPDSMWQWTSFTVISYEEVEFVVEKPEITQTIGFLGFVCFVIAGWKLGLFKKIGKFIGIG